MIIRDLIDEAHEIYGFDIAPCSGKESLAACIENYKIGNNVYTMLHFNLSCGTTKTVRRITINEN